MTAVLALSARSLGVGLADRLAGCFFVDDRAAVGECRDEGLAGEVVHRAWQSSAGLVDPGEGVVGEEGVGASAEFEMVGVMRNSSLRP
jgi:hypothetical protein